MLQLIMKAATLLIHYMLYIIMIHFDYDDYIIIYFNHNFLIFSQ